MSVFTKTLGSKRFGTILLLLIAGLGPTMAQVEPARQATSIIKKWESLRYGMFIHFGMNTYNDGLDYDNTFAPATKFNPTLLNVGQWVRTAKAAGMSYAVLTAKHTTGFCLWDSENYDYDVATSSVKTDIVGEFVKACQQEGLAYGFYYCIMDARNSEVEKQANKWQANIATPAYFNLVLQHLTELHTRYPGALEQWIDIPSNLSAAQLTTMYQTVKKANPSCLVILNQMIENSHRWQGSRIGTGLNPNSIDLFPTDLMNIEFSLPPPTGHNPVIMYQNKQYYLPLEVCDNGGINGNCGSSGNWFQTKRFRLRPAEELYKLYSDVTTRGANLLLNVPVDTSGLIPQPSVKTLLELKALIDRRK